MRLFCLFLLGTLFLFSCRPQRAIQNYVEDLSDTAMRREVLIKEPLIQKNDLLHIQVYSASTRPEIDALYNLPSAQGSGGGGSSQLMGVLVDQKGNLEFPRIGTIRAEGLTKSELAAVIKGRLQGQLESPSVMIRFLNFRITVMGEVNSPGVLNIPTERLTLLEALGMAGDITEFGQKKQVRILRENNGQREVGIIDVTSQRMFESKYYQLQQNDVILVEATRYKVRQTEQQRIAAQLGFALSIITSIALLYNIFQ